MKRGSTASLYASTNMPPDLEKWLKGAGYEHYVFLSYPRAPQGDLRKCAMSVAGAIRQRLSDYGTAEECRRVFVDELCLPTGQDWEPLLKRAVCRSVLLVAVCAPIYYVRDHEWCGREYNAMLSLRQIRRAGAIVPLIVRKFKEHPLPKAVASLQYIDVVKDATIYQDFARRPRFQQTVEHIVHLTVSVAAELRLKNAVAETSPAEFEFPAKSAFDDYDCPKELPPLRFVE